MTFDTFSGRCDLGEETNVIGRSVGVAVGSVVVRGFNGVGIATVVAGVRGTAIGLTRVTGALMLETITIRTAFTPEVIAMSRQGTRIGILNPGWPIRGAISISVSIGAVASIGVPIVVVVSIVMPSLTSVVASVVVSIVVSHCCVGSHSIGHLSDFRCCCCCCCCFGRRGRGHAACRSRHRMSPSVSS